MMCSRLSILAVVLTSALLGASSASASISCIVEPAYSAPGLFNNWSVIELHVERHLVNLSRGNAQVTLKANINDLLSKTGFEKLGEVTFNFDPAKTQIWGASTERTGRISFQLQRRRPGMPPGRPWVGTALLNNQRHKLQIQCSANLLN